MKEKLKKISEKCKLIFGYSIMINLFLGGLTVLGYIAAIIIGGGIVNTIYNVIYKNVFPVLIYATSVTVLFGLAAMYIGGEYALTASNNKNK